jgi:hypothetical protein
MSEELQVTEEASGLDRRTFVKRSAIVGGMVWAAPAITTLGSRAFAATGGTPRKCVDISYLAVVVTTNAGTFRFKYEANGACEDGANAEIAHCPTPTGWADATTLPGCDIFEVITTDACCWYFVVPEYIGDVKVNTWSVVGVAMGAGGTNSPSGQGFCVTDFTVTNGSRKYTYCSPPTKN